MSDSETATAEFVKALLAAVVVLDRIPGGLDAARVHEHAFGRLFEAHEVRDSYHQRLPETEKDLREAKDVIEHFVAGLAGGHPIAARPTAGEIPAQSPGQDAS